MATIEEAIYSRLTTWPGLAALIGDRAYPLVIPVDAGLPALAYQVISSVPKHSMTGPSGLTTTRVQITTVADTYAQSKQVDGQVRAAFNAVAFAAAGVNVQGAFIDNEQDDYDSTPPSTSAAVRTDVMLWHDAA